MTFHIQLELVERLRDAPHPEGSHSIGMETLKKGLVHWNYITPSL